jgi:hypothetical protein
VTNFSLLGADLVGFAAATCLAVGLWFLPAAFVSRIMSRLAPGQAWAALTPALAFACLPLFDALAIRFIGLAFAAAAHVAAALAGLWFARRWLPKVGAWTIAAIAVWWVYLAAVYVDVDYNGSLYQSLLVLDLVKHAAVVSEIKLHGLPLYDPFFLRNGAAGYYYYFYAGAAVVDYLGGPLIDARMAFVGLAFTCGIAFATLLRSLIVELGWQKSGDRRLTALVILACSIGGLDLIGTWVRWRMLNLTERNSEWWDDEISFFSTSASWVPHHLAAVIASFVAIVLLARAQETTEAKARLALAILAGIAIASSFGLSIWVTAGAAGVLTFSVPVMARRNLRKWLGLLMCAAIVAVVLSLPQIADLASGRVVNASPLELWIREPARISELLGHSVSVFTKLALTPLAWAIEFGAFALGAYAFAKRTTFNTDTILWRLMVCSLAAGLAMNLFVRSAIINNDFGWRVAWFAAVPAMAMTVAVLQQPPATRAWRIGFTATIVLGFGATLYNLVSARIPLGTSPRSLAYINDDPKTDYALQRAYRWAARALPRDAVLQHNPAANPRALDFGLYGIHRTGVADGQAMLFGAPPDRVQDRVESLRKVFDGSLPPTAAAGLHLVVTSRDGLWRRLQRSECLYLSDRVCITRKIGR